MSTVKQEQKAIDNLTDSTEKNTQSKQKNSKIPSNSSTSSLNKGLQEYNRIKNLYKQMIRSRDLMNGDSTNQKYKFDYGNAASAYQEALNNNNLSEKSASKLKNLEQQDKEAITWVQSHTQFENNDTKAIEQNTIAIEKNVQSQKSTNNISDLSKMADKAFKLDTDKKDDYSSEETRLAIIEKENSSYEEQKNIIAKINQERTTDNRANNSNPSSVSGYSSSHFTKL